MQRCRCSFIVGLLLTQACACRAQTLEPGEIRLLGKIVSVDPTRKQFVVAAERFVLPPNREGVLKEKKNKLVTVDDKTTVCFASNRQQKLSLADLKAGMDVSVTGKDLGEGKALPAREVVVSSQKTGVGEREKGGVGEREPGGKGETGKPKTGFDAVQDLLKQGDTEKALTSLIPLLTADWQNPQAWRLAVRVLGKAKLSERNDLGNRFRNELLAAAGENNQKRNQVLLALTRGGFPDIALPEYETMLAKDALDAAAWTGKALAQLDQYQIEAAQASAHRATQVNGNYAPGFVAKGKAQVAAWLNQAALETLAQAVEKGPGNADAHGLRAQAYLQQNNEAGAEPAIRRALELDSENPEGLFALAILQERRREGRAAQTTWKKYLDLYPSDVRAASVRMGCVIVETTQVKAGAGVHADPSFSPDGKKLTFHFDGPLYIKNADNTGDATRITEGPGYYRFPTWASDGVNIAYDVATGQPEKWQVEVRDLKTGTTRRASPEQPEAWRPKFSPDGKKLLMWDARPGSTGLVEVTLADGSESRVPASKGRISWYGTWHPTKEMVAAHRNVQWQPYLVRNIILISLEHPEQSTLLVGEDGIAIHPTFAPDGSRLLYTIGWKGKTWDLRMMDAESTGRSVSLGVTSELEMYPPAWSPDGTHIAYALQGGGGIHVASIGGLRGFMHMDVRAIPDTVDTGAAETSLEVTLRNRIQGPQEATIGVQMPGDPAAVKGGTVRLTVPAKQEATQTFTLRTGKRGTHQVIVKAKGEEFDLEKTVTVRVVEKWEDKVRVVVLPLFNLWAYEPEKHWPAAAVWKLVMEKLSRLWQLRVPNMGSPRDSFLLTGKEGMSYGYTTVVGEGGKQVRRPMPDPNAVPLDKLDQAGVEKIARVLSHSHFAVWGALQLQETGKVSVELKLIDLKAKKPLPDKDIKGEWDLNQLPDVAGELSRRICEALGVKLEAEQLAWLGKTPTRNLDAMRGLGQAVVPMMSWEQDEARNALLGALAQDPQFAEAHKALGYAYLWQNKSNEALGEFRVAASLDPEDAGAIAGESQPYERSGQTQQRIAALERILALDAYHPHALHSWATEKLVPEGRLEEATVVLQKSLLDPYRSPELRAGSTKALQRVYERAPQTDPALKVALTTEFKDAPLGQIVRELSQAAKMAIAITAPNLTEAKVSLPPVKTVGEIMSAIANQVKGQWQRTEAGYFLVAKEGER